MPSKKDSKINYAKNMHSYIGIDIFFQNYHNNYLLLAIQHNFMSTLDLEKLHIAR